MADLKSILEKKLEGELKKLTDIIRKIVTTTVVTTVQNVLSDTNEDLIKQMQEQHKKDINDLKKEHAKQINNVKKEIQQEQSTDDEYDDFVKMQMEDPIVLMSEEKEWNEDHPKRNLLQLSPISNKPFSGWSFNSAVTFQRSCVEYLKDFNEILPDRSANRYHHAYDQFMKWQQQKGTNTIDEPVLLDYFIESSQKLKPSTLWSMFSMLKSSIISNHDINISEYSELTDFLKEKNDGFQSKKTKVFTTEEINKFLMEAPDYCYLAMKTVVVFAMIGLCNTMELTNFKTNYLKDNGNEIIVRIPDKKSKKTKVHVIEGQYADIVRKYIILRPAVDSDRFFFHYRDGICSEQIIGKNYIAKFPKKMAKFLELPESDSYTTLSYRRTLKTNSAEPEVSTKFETRKRHGQLVYSNVPEESSPYKRTKRTPELSSAVSYDNNCSSTSTTSDNHFEFINIKRNFDSEPDYDFATNSSS